MKNLCTRSVDFTPIRDDADTGDGRTLEGYGAVFDVPTRINSWEGCFDESIAPGAFRKTLSERKPVMQFDHGRDARTGSVPIAAIQEIREDPDGLYVKASMFDNPVVEPIRQAIEGGAIKGMSFRFNVVRDEWRDAKGVPVRPEELQRLLYGTRDPDRTPLQRTLKEVQLFEVGPVVNPAYTQTSVGVRSLSDEERTELVEEYVRSMSGPEDVPGPGGPPTPSPLPGDKAVDDEATRSTPAPVPGPGGPPTPSPLPGDKAIPEATTDAAPTRDTSVENTTTPPAPGTSSGHDDTTDRKAVPMAKTIAELRARLDEIDVRMLELGGDATRSLEEAEETEFTALETERADAEAAIEKIEARAELLRKVAARSPRRTERGTDQGAPGFNRSPEDIFDLGAVRSASTSDADYVKRLRDNALRAVEAADFGEYDKQAAQTQVEKLLRTKDNKRGELAARLLSTGSEAYERAWGKMVMSGGTAFLTGEERDAVERAQAASTDSAGGYAVPFQLDPTVMLDNASTINPIRQLARQVQIVGKQWNGVTSTGASVSRGAEASTAPDSSFTLAQPTITTNRVQGFVPFSIEIDLEWNALRSEIGALLMDAKAREEDSFFTGDGTGTNPFGVVATNTSTAASTVGAAALAAADLYTLETTLAPRWRAKGQFVGNKTILNKIRQFDTAGGAQLWQRVGAGLPSELLGYPVHEASAMASVLTTGTKILLFGDFSNFLIVDRIGMTVELIPQVFDASNSNRPTGQRGIYAIWMNNSKILVQNAIRALQTS
jgi:HK97 family phage major capsid protein/HK97 family phage prohead protease